jgi:S-(hydroxymethyl)glutathione dehydrogenase / alcohol dehydrogenase
VTLPEEGRSRDSPVHARMPPVRVSACNPKTNLCQAIRSTQGQGVMPDGSSRFSLDGRPLLHYMGCSTFSNFTVLPEIALAKVREDAPFDKVCYIGCGVTTGIGAVFHRQGRARLHGRGVRPRRHRAQRDPGRAHGGRRHDHRRRPQPGQGGLATASFGMTDFINPAEVARPGREIMVELTNGGVDYSFECIGNVKVMRQALECCHKGWGTSPTSSASPAPGRRSPRAPSSWSPAAPGAAAPSAARAAAPTCPRLSTGTWRARSTSTT